MPVLNMDKRITIRFNNILEKKLQDLLKQYPEDYRCESSIFRAGVIALHHKRMPKLETSQMEAEQLMEKFPQRYQCYDDVVKEAIRTLHSRTIPQKRGT